MRSEFVFTDAPFASAHASTIAETAEGLVAAWFAGQWEGHPEVGIWLARTTRAGWSAPVEVARGADRLGRRRPCWNPVLHQARAGPLLLFYKVGPSPRRWWGMLTTSEDGGRSWASARRLPRGILGPVKNKPIELADGALLCPSSTEQLGWRAHMEVTVDLGRTWQRMRALGSARSFAAIQPTLLVWPDGRLQALCRTRQGVIATSWSTDGGRAWSPLQATALPNPDSGIDAVLLADGRALLVYNHGAAARHRSPLNLALSTDGVQWQPSLVLEDGPGEFSYPAVIQSGDGRVHVTYTWQRRLVRHVTLAPDQL
jgi:predicted neuraminidase